MAGTAGGTGKNDGEDGAGITARNRFAGNKVKDVLFCEDFLAGHPTKCIHGRFFDVNGAVSDMEQIKAEIYQKIAPYVTSNIASDKEEKCLQVADHEGIIGNEEPLCSPPAFSGKRESQYGYKIRSTMTTKARAGIYHSTVPPFGYRKSPKDSRKLIPDAETASRVRHMYEPAVQGKCYKAIGNVLIRERIPKPAYWRHIRGEGTWAGFQGEGHISNYIWNETTIKWRVV